MKRLTGDLQRIRQSDPAGTGSIFVAAGWTPYYGRICLVNASETVRYVQPRMRRAKMSVL